MEDQTKNENIENTEYISLWKYIIAVIICALIFAAITYYNFGMKGLIICETAFIIASIIIAIICKA